MNLITLDKISSTQTFLLEEDKELSLPEFTVAYTENQTQGKGQGTHVWESEEGKNISFSLLLRPYFLDPSMQYLITQIVSLAIVDTLKEYIKEGVKIKWPNDIYVNDNKICGMLIQNKLLGSSFAGVYCGIGININQKNFLLAPNPTSIYIETGKQTDKKEVFNLAIKNIEKRYTQLKQEDIKSIQEEYLSLLLYRNEWRLYEYKGEKIRAKIICVNEFGHLIFEKEDGEVSSCELREWRFFF
ncbi:MAG: biotin--[Bacteroidales bacterium]|nr:biotin--[acetyl-CoA-carboxylase] ligase [Bacteroidales bacterium]